MGHLNESLTNNCEEFLEETMQKLSERLKDIRLELVNTNEEINPGALIFPSEFERLQPGLKAFVQGAFKESTYQETPLLRGIFFSSARQGDTPHPAFFQKFLLKEQKDSLNGDK
jgi:type VI secretion system protein ImpL